MVTPYPEQLKGKRRDIARAFEQAGLAEPPFLSPPVVASEPLAYRSRIRLTIRDRRIAFFNPQKATDCPVLSRPLRDALAHLAQVFDTIPELAAEVHHLELREPDAHGRPGLWMVLGEDAPDTAVAYRRVMLEQALAGWLVGVHGQPPPAAITTGWGRVRVHVPLGSFMQVNARISAALVGAVAERARHSGARTFVDLFAGAGNFALALASLGLAGHAVEIDPHAVEAMRTAAKEQHLALTVVAEDASKPIAAPPAAPVDLLVANPPRAGLRDSYRRVVELRPREIALVSCEPRAVARDAARLVDNGFTLEAVQGFDMFAQTAHVETLVWLREAVGQREHSLAP